MPLIPTLDPNTFVDSSTGAAKVLSRDPTTGIPSLSDAINTPGLGQVISGGSGDGAPGPKDLGSGSGDLFGGFTGTDITINGPGLRLPRNNPSYKLRNNPYTAPQFYYPFDLGGEGQEPYVIFDIRDGIAKDAKSKGTIALMMPAEIKAGYRAVYEETSMAIFGGINADVKGGWEALKNHGEEWSQNPLEAAKSLFKTVAGDGVVDTAYATALNASAAIQRAARAIVNPHMAVLFQGMGFRTFPMNFSLIARNNEESDMIRNIIYTFKYYMHPSLPKDVSTNRFLLYPENFVIAFVSPSTEYMFKISACVLEAMDVDYNGSGIPAFYQDTGAPVHINLSLQFKECEVLTKDRIYEGL